MWWWAAKLLEVRYLRLARTALAALVILSLVACSSAPPPTELAPDGEVVRKAIALQLQQSQQRLSEGLKAPLPTFEIGPIQVQKLEALSVSQLPTYHLQGTYRLTLTLPRQQVTRQGDRFDLYLQRQVEGKTWRLLKPQVDMPGASPQWKSYSIEP